MKLNYWKSNNMQLLIFKATWCGPCKMLSKLMEDIVFPYETNTVDLDENMDLALKYNVRSVPTLLLLDDQSKVIQQHLGVPQNKTLLEDKFITPYV